MAERAREKYPMSKTMLIDAAHPEETRVAIVEGRQVEEFDFESRAKRQLRGLTQLRELERICRDLLRPSPTTPSRGRGGRVDDP